MHDDRPIDLNPWRSIGALAELLNQGAKHPSFSTHALRHYVRHSDANGLSPYVRRLGRKILVSEPGFRQWLANGAGEKVG